MNDCRILSLDEALPERGPGWRRVASGADVVLIPGDLVAAESSVRDLMLPVIVRVAADRPALPHWLDLAEALLLPGDADDRLGGLARRLLATGPAGVAELSDTAQNIAALGQEAQRIADRLAQLAQAADSNETPVNAALVRKLIRLRRDRDRHLPADLFGDPAWDMLLDLTAARMEQADVPVSSLCLAAAVPTTTALRWVRTLSEAGLFVRRTDPADARRAFITLSDTAFQAMMAWLNRFSRQFQPR